MRSFDNAIGLSFNLGCTAKAGTEPINNADNNARVITFFEILDLIIFPE